MTKRDKILGAIVPSDDAPEFKRPPSGVVDRSPQLEDMPVYEILKKLRERRARRRDKESEL